MMAVSSLRDVLKLLPMLLAAVWLAVMPAFELRNPSTLTPQTPIAADATKFDAVITVADRIDMLNSDFVIAGLVMAVIPTSYDDAALELAGGLGAMAKWAAKYPKLARYFEKTLDKLNATNRTLPEGSPYSQADYDAYVQRKLDAGETPKSPEDYIATRQQFDKGSAAHQAGVEQELELQRNTYGDDAFIVENKNVNSADGCVTCMPDIMVYDPNTNTLHVTEVKTGDATLTPNQVQVYPEIADGSATMNASQLDALGLDISYAGQPISSIQPPINIVVEEVRY